MRALPDAVGGSVASFLISGGIRPRSPGAGGIMPGERINVTWSSSPDQSPTKCHASSRRYPPTTDRNGLSVQPAPRSLEEGEGADFDALARRRIGRRGRILERRVHGEPRATVARRIEAFDEQHLVALHAREIEPAVTRAVGHRVDLADAVGIAPLGRHQIAPID